MWSLILGCCLHVELFPPAKHTDRLLQESRVHRTVAKTSFSSGVATSPRLKWEWANVRCCGCFASQGALDEGMLKLLEENGVPSYPFFHKGLDGSNQHSSDSWKKFAIGRMSQVRAALSLQAPDTRMVRRMRSDEPAASPRCVLSRGGDSTLPPSPWQVRALLKLGYDALMTDIDVGWLKNPTPYLYCTGVRASSRLPHASVHHFGGHTRLPTHAASPPNAGGRVADSA